MFARSKLLGLSFATVLSCLAAAGGDVQASDDARQGKSATRTTLTVEITELRNNKGRVAVALFDSEDAFPEQERALRGKLAKIANKRAQVSFSGLKPGTYAIAVLHDENENDEMDFNFVGMPLEGYGFSNDASAMFGPPSFEAASFEVGARSGKKRIKTRYFSL